MNLPEAGHLRTALSFTVRYAAAQRELLSMLDRAPSSGAWPAEEHYHAVGQLGRQASSELRAFANAVKRLRLESRIQRIQRTSAAERTWQPSPSQFLDLFDAR